MYRKMTPATLAVAVFLSAMLPLAAGEPAPAPAPNPAVKPPAKPKSIEEIIEAIPAGPLDEGVLLQAGAIKVSGTVVDRVESAYVVSEKKRQPKFNLTPELKT